MKRKIDLTGKQIGRLLVLEEDFNYVKEHNLKSKNVRYWKCQCSCENHTIKSIAQSCLSCAQPTLSCGCLQRENVSKKNCKDLTGQQFGLLTILHKSEIKKNGRIYWHCRCACDNQTECDIEGSKLISGHTKSCGCLRYNDLSGKVFGRLTAIEPTIERRKRSVVWRCQCSCELQTIVYVPSDLLVSGKTQSCGCLKSSGESKIQEILLANNIIFEREKIFPDLINKETQCPFRYDFYLSEYNRLIEFDGEQHYSYKENTIGWNNKENFEKCQQHDKIKNEYAWNNNIELIRIPYLEKDNITLESLLNDKYLYKK